LSAASRPNVLLITTDQQAALAVGAAGNADLATPAMDALGERGVRFERAYCTFPLCTPSRASLYTGRMPHEVGADYNNKPIAPEFRSRELGNLMADAGYDCAYGGKWHVPEIEIGEGHGFSRICGFDDWALADRCIDFLRTPRGAPFFLVASFDNPHNICEHSRRQRLPWGPVPQAPVGACPNLPANFEVPAYEPSLIKQERALRPASELTEDEWRLYRHTYYRLIEKVDAEVARIMAALAEAGHHRDTLVIFTSDHGETLGDHGLICKGCRFYEGLVRVPLILRWPGQIAAGATTDALVELTDLAPTLLDAAGLPVPEHMAGRSLLPLLRGAIAEHRAEVRSEYYAALRSLDRVLGRWSDSRSTMIRDRRYKLAVYHGHPTGELFDLQEDPHEHRNLWHDADHAELRFDLLRRCFDATAFAIDTGPEVTCRF
jgi:arylsulfatase A-like enzyme